MNTFIAEAESMGDVLRRSCEKYAGRPAILVPTKESFTTLTYSDLWEEVVRYARAIDSLGLQKGDRVCVIGETCVEWVIVDWACQCLGLVTVPIYPTLPPDQAQYIVKDCGAKAAICADKKQADKVVAVDGLNVLVWNEEDGYEHVFKNESTLTEDELNTRISAVSKDELATLIYTSGTTGNPKGVMLTHNCFISLSAPIQEGFPVDETDSFFIFLPLSHVFARFVGQFLSVAIGGSTAFAGSIASIAKDMNNMQPTVVIAVPRFLEAMRAKIIDNVEKSGGLKKTLFYSALSQSLKRHKGQFAPFAGALDSIVGKKIRERTGGKIRFFVSGGAALSPHVNEFYNAINLTVVQGYGLTETTAASSLNHPDDNRSHTVGAPLPGVEIKIAGDGEILQKGPSVMMGYFNLPEATAEAIDADGWFHTGDIGEWDGEHLLITDRKKDILVLSNGKNISPLLVESKLKESEYINEVVLFGDGIEYCCALIIPEFERIKTWLE